MIIIVVAFAVVHQCRYLRIFFIGSITNIKAHQMVEKLHGCLDQQAPLHNPPGTAVPAVLFTDARRLLQPSSKCCSGVRLLVSNGRQYDEL
ncbi:hypothetical protein T4B_5666 [Trichinella pseudospiralis]|uniref:Uncharacterized protein n=1 Tax=Trichinella pseudospiralis TaxID=6337 RepID=A0A0V1EJZ7_TRIPS|nr:hypothetical protein T4A_13823 [Trichinella pseudospiralis]KRZ25208.1 hypothetical protein T4B_5666 [Trichinella pseudospiralis]KRZ40148.1 hypothetical protein T4C_5845 [Trichinella pseudospiralis]